MRWIPFRREKSGQAIIFLMMVMVIGLLVVLWNYDLHNIVSTKIRVGNAGDAAALAAARWQGITLNMVGELNLVQAALLCEDGDVEKNLQSVYEVSELRDRLALNGPLMGYVAAQSAAFMNLNANDVRNIDNDFAEMLAKRAELFMNSPGAFLGVVEPPYDGAWIEYGNLLSAIASSEMVVECGNPKWFLFYNGSHILLNAQFYNAIASRYWCWFELNGKRHLLTDYTGFNYWDPLPELRQRPSVNSEYFGTDLERLTTRLLQEVQAQESNIASTYDFTFGIGEDAMTNQFYETIYSNIVSREVIEETAVKTNLSKVVNLNLPWHFYEMNSWNQRWPTAADGFPFRTNWNVKYEYDYKGADAAIYTFINAVNITPRIRMDDDWIRWIAAAKPFGYLEVPQAQRKRNPPHYFGLVLPAFHDVRLIPNDISSRPEGISVPGWDIHIYEHLPAYLEGGPAAIKDNNCWYCRQLIKWEDPSFRAEGDAWLREFSERCYIHGSGGHGGGGFGGTSDWR